ncbi:Protoporphyrin uptake protein 1 [Colletotrichum gloeosporioides]|uniref:Protoporphyrin uptake protein 1 n=1 Tax=Colletotrichum gloeosporioides TaxID=474922 RepID=A0A8H4CCC0_COLGL|nr:Protoporphyrin uptake protein 1 [Colletotrichum gloeosporioides]KAF3801371.1 Protoporphyrin uptake protein 1 [Colletotrichum gloeosporioides]
MSKCTEIHPICPVEATVYGYYPNVGGNAFLLTIFIICTVSQLSLGVKYRLRAFTTVMVIGCLLEALGYIGRLMMSKNPWSGVGFRLQVICLILAPSFLAAGIYLTLKHLVLYIGPENSRLAPKWYTWIFISCDAISFLMQAAGGAAASSSDGGSAAETGNNIMIAGIAVQVVTMGICGLLAVDLPGGRSGTGAVGQVIRPSWMFRFYLSASAAAFIAIFIRCIYRLPEMAGGWGNPLMRKEEEFIVLDGMMIAVACLLVSIAHPGIFFPAISSREGETSKTQAKSTHPVDSEYPMGSVPASS